MANDGSARKLNGKAWHLLGADDAALALDTDIATGQGGAEVARRIALYGRNELRESRGRPPWRILLDQFSDFIILVLIAAAIISGLIGEPGDTLAIIAILLLNGIIGFVQEYRAERAMAALKRIAAPSAMVLRDGQRATVPTHDLVPGDVVLLEAGNVIPADLRLHEAVRLKVNEAALTGESVPVDKLPAKLEELIRRGARSSCSPPCHATGARSTACGRSSRPSSTRARSSRSGGCMAAP